ncbi:MAG TPA: LacI family DNA-binding transcriptional regulator [Glycomyces sp.]|nr:LacI family DNA-binding transcriptional regulator [Glycomyces sp.]
MSTPHGPAGAPGAVTIAQIAERAGVSIPTVSKVINGRADVAPATRERVEAAIRRSGYRRPSASGAARLVEITFHEFEGPFAIEIIKGVEQVAREHRLGVVVSELQGRLAPDHTWLADILERRPRGIVAVFSQIHSVQVERLAARGIPIVLVDPTGEPAHDTPSVGATNWSGGLSATGHLIDLGHRRIGVISGPETIPCGQARLEGHRAALRAAGIPLEAELVRHGDFRVEGGREHAEALLRLEHRPTAIFAGNDVQALGVYQAARAAGLRVPEDLSVVGFDDLSLAAWADPPLTTVRQPLTEMAATATRTLVQLARGASPSATRIELATSLVERGSTAPPRR